MIHLAALIVTTTLGFADCNGNGIDDAVDIANGTSLDCNLNSNPDECDMSGVEPLAYWRFEEEGAVILDSGPFDLDGTAVNSAAIDDVPVDPVPQSVETNLRARLLAGVGSITVPDPNGVLTMGGASFTIEAWVRLDQLADGPNGPARQTLVQKKVLTHADTRADYLVLVQGGSVQNNVAQNFGKTSGFSGREIVLGFGDGTNFWTVTSFLEIQQTGWHHVSVAYDAAQSLVRFELDGYYHLVEVTGSGHVGNSGPLLVGAHTNSSGTFNHFLRGAIDELRIVEGVVPGDLLLSSHVTADCNLNGIPDGCDIDAGTSQDCDQNGQPDSCQLVDNDCDGNGIPDQCDPDCNANGIADVCDIVSGTSADCQPDGIPDECQLEQYVDALYDIGWGAIAVRADEPYMAWLNRFNVTDDAGMVEAIDVLFAFIPIGTPIGLHVWSDPNGDGDPTDAQLLWSDDSVVQATGILQRYEVPSVLVGTTGASFFVGLTCIATDPDFPAVLDISGEPEGDRSWLVGSNSPIDLNDLSAGAVEFGRIESIIFGGNWVLRAHMRGEGTDCNGNGIPDDCDIADGASVDADGNGVPDECEDCNGNGIVDGFDIAEATSSDCDGDGVPDECQLASHDCDGNGIPDACQLDGGDCNGNGILDACDIASGLSVDVDQSGVPDECEDCNGNGVLDGTDIAIGTSDDCNLDGLPDECQYGAPLNPATYAYDDGTRESNLNVLAVLELAWMNRFTVQPGAEHIAAIEVVWGNTYPSLPALVVLWSDPDGDGIPIDAQVIVTVATESVNVNDGTYTTVPIPPTYVGPAGTSFFAGVYFNDFFNTAPTAIDVDEPSAEQSWIAWHLPGNFDLNDLSAGELMHWFYHDFMIRAVGFDAGMEHECNGNWTLDACDIASGQSADANGNGVPDECECVGDLDGNGFVDFADVLVVLSNWGDPYEFSDLLLVLGGWGACSP